jgi:hypothetical protein
MKCDMDLVRHILLEIENQNFGYAPTNFTIDSYTHEQIYYHAYIMIQGGLIEGTVCIDLDSTSPQAIPKNLTLAGHEFLKVARDDTFTVAVLSQLLSSLMKSHFGLT